METITIKRGRDSVENIDDYKSEKLASLKGSLKHLEKSIDVYTDVLNIAGSKGISVYSEIDIDTICDITKAISDMSWKIHCSHMLVQQKHPEVANEAFELSETSKSSEDFNGQLKGILSDENTTSDEENNDFSSLSYYSKEEIFNFALKYIQVWKGKKPIEETRHIIISLLEELDIDELNTKMPIIFEYKDLIIEYLKKYEAKGRSELAKQNYFESHQKLIKKESDFKDFLKTIPVYFN